jgi:hypothetical protein
MPERLRLGTTSQREQLADRADLALRPVADAVQRIADRAPRPLSDRLDQSRRFLGERSW